MQHAQLATLPVRPRPSPGAPRSRSAPARLPPDPHLQRPPFAGACACGGACPRCNSAAQSLAAVPIQRKPAIKSAADAEEREAEDVANKVVGMAGRSPGLQGTPGAGTTVAMRTGSDGDMEPGPRELAEVVASGIGERGRMLDDSTLAFMESRFGRDFRAVRIHSGAHAAASAQALGALAYTVGRDIVVGESYVPGTSQGRHLLAHELTHTVQQGHAPSTSMQVDGQSLPTIHTAGEGQVQRAYDCTLKSKANCVGNCIPAGGLGTGFCAWSGAIKTGCVCYVRDQPSLKWILQVMFDLIIDALIVAGIVVSIQAVALIVACLMGPCQVAGLIAALGYAGAMIVMGILRWSRGSETAVHAPPPPSGPEDRTDAASDSTAV